MKQLLVDACPKCGKFQRGTPSSSGRVACDCGHSIDYFIFATDTPRTSGRGTRAAEGDAVCFDHPQKRAEQECQRCGKFLCGLCAIQFGGAFVCPECLRSGRDDLAVGGATLPKSVFCPESASSALGLLACILPWIGVLLAPVAIGLGIRGLKKPGSRMRRRRFQPVLGIVLGAASIASHILFFL